LVTTPSQLPPQAEPSVVQAARAPCGAPAIGVHVPTLPATSQASHWPAQAVLQQTPSAQWPEPHSRSAAQAAPGPPLGRHALPEHQSAGLQSASPEQEVRQAVAPQAKGAQETVDGAGQEPVPPQAEGRVAVPLAHEALRQEVPAPG
jgi:hypothetical protein